MTARIGIVGTGWWANFNHIPTINETDGAEVVAICDLDADRLAQVGDKWGISARYTDVAAMLAAEALDGVMISTPHVAHTGPAIAALQAGCHVLVEKPMATTEADGRAIAAAAARAGREVLVPCGMNFTPFSRTAAQMVRDGRIGEVRHAVCQMGSALEDLFAGQPMLETADHMFRPPASTWADPEKAGGYGWGQMSHALSWLVYVADLRFESIYCAFGRSPTGVDYYDAAVGRATNGATVSFSGASTVPKHVGMHMDMRIYGTEGCLFFDNERARLELRRLDGKDELVEIAQQEAEYDGTLPVRVFAALCAGEDVKNAADAENGARVTEALHAFYRSADSGEVALIGGAA
ncbi:Gfo/Idh/MocA family protein [Oceanomicrobium pacificus]|uniref:Gfo/Idh/MocA family oxidoreductase n=1 Tax=Oceanomicrobium pacificus TaxID=2692916 RepID=A0A6B0TVY6_9RHOB|nr:Gfo/Idh/MocA family oxidoreductase [Oceanomicrobium pacificus]MXU65153.1 Gfo/Idh/MocA family oxidoreductase [Oceanomicrobium pacificus]